jgi:hypothetical protein
MCAFSPAKSRSLVVSRRPEIYPSGYVWNAAEIDIRRLGGPFPDRCVFTLAQGKLRIRYLAHC